MRKYSYLEIMIHRPCRNPIRHFGNDKNWVGTALDILKIKSMPAKDKMWLVYRLDVLNNLGKLAFIHKFGDKDADRRPGYDSIDDQVFLAVNTTDNKKASRQVKWLLERNDV